MSMPFVDAFHEPGTRNAGVAVQRAVMVRRSQSIRATAIGRKLIVLRFSGR
jgi:hypothetical protein